MLKAKVSSKVILLYKQREPFRAGSVNLQSFIGGNAHVTLLVWMHNCPLISLRAGIVYQYVLCGLNS